jgi:hypothetical protein
VGLLVASDVEEAEADERGPLREAREAFEAVRAHGTEHIPGAIARGTSATDNGTTQTGAHSGRPPDFSTRAPLNSG